MRDMPYIVAHNVKMKTESKRQKQVSEVIRRNFGLVLLEQGNYIYGDALVTVTSVKTSPDFSLAKIYLSVYNTENKESVLEALRYNATPLRNELAKRIRKHVRKIPQIDMYLDETLDEMFRLEHLFKEINEKDKAIRATQEEE